MPAPTPDLQPSSLDPERTRPDREGSRPDPEATYRARESFFRDRRDAAAGRAGTLSTFRGLAFVGAVAALILWEALPGLASWLSLAGCGALLVVFGVLVARHRRARREERRADAFRRLNREGLLRLERRWDELADAAPEAHAMPGAPDDHAYAADVHCFGRASISVLAGPVTSEPGRRTFARWLLAPADAVTVRSRQEAVRELAPELELRQELAVAGRLTEEPPAGSTDLFLEWAETPEWLRPKAGVRAAAWLLPAATTGLVLAWFFTTTIPLLWAAVPFGAGFALYVRFQARIGADFDVASRAEPGVGRYAEQIGMLEGRSSEAERLLELGGRLEGGAGELARLGRILDTVVSRGNLFYQSLAPIFLLDFHLHARLERWKRDTGARARDWIEALGETEALMALSSLAWDNPDWTFPDETRMEPGEVRVEATALGHPLLHPDECVRNDVTVGPPGTFLLVTGSNMSGKSTLLRALGSNVVLAGAGGPVCAEELRLPPLRLQTSMLVGDSLADGVSRFMAELLRMRRIVDAARDADPGDPPVLFLLDEILQGTNTAERRVAARAVIRHLLESGAVGAVTTHDLTLHEAPDLVERADAWHFREEVGTEDGRTKLVFDYTLRKGLATTRNALKLLEAVGLGEEGEGGEVEIERGGEGP